MIFSNRIALYIFLLLFISLLELVKSTLPNESGTVFREGRRSSSPRKNSPSSRNSSSRRSSSSRKNSPSRARSISSGSENGERSRSSERMYKVRKQLNADSSKIVQDMYTLHRQSSMQHGRRNSGGFRRQSSITSSLRGLRLSRQHSSSSNGQPSLPSPVGRPFQRSFSLRNWKPFG
uniref:Uncharacterized protein n=1 Tax=Strongyloides venezuelensis TaxID=75913 RepID=A0A0K0FZJ2_STRVS